MKKLLTTVLIGVSMFSFAQSNYSDLSQNHLTENGYEFNWNTSAETNISANEYNCINNPAIYHPYKEHTGDIYQYSVQNNALVFQTKGGSPVWNVIRLVENCESVYLDLSKYENPVIEYRVKTDTDLKYLGLQYMYIDENETLEDEFISGDASRKGSSINTSDGWVEGSFEIGNFGILTGIDLHPTMVKENPTDQITANITFDYIRIVEGTTPIVTNVIDVENDLMSMYPNPASDLVNIQLNKKDLTVSVLNYLGQEVKNVSVEGTEIALDISVLETGLYFLQIKDEEGILQVERLVVK